MAARTSRSESASESASSAVLDGAGLIGDSIGITVTQFITTTGTTPGVPRFTTGTIFTEAETYTAGLTAPAADFVLAPKPGAGLPTGTSAALAGITTVPAQRTGLSMETPELPEDTLNPAVKAAPARAPSAA